MLLGILVIEVRVYYLISVELLLLLMVLLHGLLRETQQWMMTLVGLLLEALKFKGIQILRHQLLLLLNIQRGLDESLLLLL